MSSVNEFVAFANRLFDTGDFSPALTAFRGVPMGLVSTSQWLITYWLFDNPGAACIAAEHQKDHFWAYLLGNAKNISRGPRRAMFDHKQAFATVCHLEDKYRIPSLACNDLSADRDSWTEAFSKVLSWPSFSAEDAFRVLYSLERTYPAVTPQGDFVWCCLNGFRLSYHREAAQAARVLFPPTDPTDTAKILLKKLGKRKTPPGNDRSLRLQEVKIALEKWNQHLEGRYVVGQEIAALRSSLLHSGPLAEKMLKKAPPEVRS